MLLNPLNRVPTRHANGEGEGMCVEKARRIRRRSNHFICAADTTSVQFLPPNIARVALIISPPASGRISVGFGETAVLNRGITSGFNGSPIVLQSSWFGDDITQAINVIAGGPINVGITEITEWGGA